MDVVRTYVPALPRGSCMQLLLAVVFPRAYCIYNGPVLSPDSIPMELTRTRWCGPAGRAVPTTQEQRPAPAVATHDMRGGESGGRPAITAGCWGSVLYYDSCISHALPVARCECAGRGRGRARGVGGSRTGARPMHTLHGRRWQVHGPTAY